MVRTHDYDSHTGIHALDSFDLRNVYPLRLQSLRHLTTKLIVSNGSNHLHVYRFTFVCNASSGHRLIRPLPATISRK